MYITIYITIYIYTYNHVYVYIYMIFIFSLYITTYHYIDLPSASLSPLRGWTIIRQAVEVGRAMLPLGDFRMDFTKVHWVGMGGFTIFNLEPVGGLYIHTVYIYIHDIRTYTYTDIMT